MKLKQLFPGFAVSRLPVAETHGDWASLLAMDDEAALSAVADVFGLSTDSEVRHKLLSSQEIGLLIPLRTRDARNHKLWKLAVNTTGNSALIFSCPSVEYFHTDGQYPASYYNVVSRLGAFQFTQSSGHLVWPNEIQQLSEHVMAIIEQKMKILAFFNHRTGDMDCWSDISGYESYLFDHETRSVQLYTFGGFAKWFESRYLEILDGR